jgi:hypothetical protein
MKALRKIAVLGATAAVAVSGLVLATPASADPVSNTYAAVGSDTLDSSMNALANGSTVTGATVRVTVGGNAFGSFDAFPTGSLIQTKPAGPYFVRPSGSGNGVTSLRASITGNAWQGKVITGQVDIARSSSSAGSNANANGLLAYVPYARDAVAYAYKAADSNAAAVLSNLTSAQLNSIYSASTPTTINGVTITPRLPQSGSGTRSFWLKALNGGSSELVPGAAVPSTDNTSAGPAENDAAALGVNQIIPFSAANWIAQSNGVQNNTIGSTGVQLGAIDGVSPFTGSGSSLVPAAAFYSSTTYGRDTYLVVEYAKINSADSKYDASLASLVSSLTSYGSLPSTPGAVKTKFGFRAPSSTSIVRAYASL